jgi:hypothetical protein
MQTRLLVGGGEERRLASAVGGEGRSKVKLKALGKVVLSFNLGAEQVGGGPALSDDKAVGLIGPLALELSVDKTRLLILLASNAEGDVGRGDSLDLEAVTREVKVLVQQVVGGLAEILRVESNAGHCVSACARCLERRTYLPGWGNGLRERHGCRSS